PRHILWGDHWRHRFRRLESTVARSARVKMSARVKEETPDWTQDILWVASTGVDLILKIGTALLITFAAILVLLHAQVYFTSSLISSWPRIVWTDTFESMDGLLHVEAIDLCCGAAHTRNDWNRNAQDVAKSKSISIELLGAECEVILDSDDLQGPVNSSRQA